MAARPSDRWYVKDGVLFVEDQRGAISAIAFILPGPRSKQRGEMLAKVPDLLGLVRSARKLHAGGTWFADWDRRALEALRGTGRLGHGRVPVAGARRRR